MLVYHDALIMESAPDEIITTTARSEASASHIDGATDLEFLVSFGIAVIGRAQQTLPRYPKARSSSDRVAVENR